MSQLCASTNNLKSKITVRLKQGKKNLHFSNYYLIIYLSGSFHRYFFKKDVYKNTDNTVQTLNTKKYTRLQNNQINYSPNKYNPLKRCNEIRKCSFIHFLIS